MLIVDAANVIGSRPTGWWRDRPGAARRFVASVRSAVAAGEIEPPVTVVLEGQSRRGEPEGTADGVEVIHAAGEGDDSIAQLAAEHPGATVVTADRELRRRVEDAGASVVGPSWLLGRLAD